VEACSKKRKTFKFAGRCQKEIQQQSVSMLYLNNPSLNGVGRRNTLLRDAVQTDDLDENKTKYNTMPSRERGKMLGTQDTLDSLFIPNHHGSVDNAAIHSPINTPVGSPKLSEQRQPEGHRTQSLDHIIEEPPVIVIHENKEYETYHPLDDRRSDRSRASSVVSLSRTLNDYIDGSLDSKLSISHSDVVNALEQLQIAVTDAVDQRVAKRTNVCFYLTHCLCLGLLLFLGLLFVITVATFVMILSLHYRTDSGVYEYSRFLTDIMTNPRQTAHLLNSDDLSVMARRSYSIFYEYLTSQSNRD